ncbi:murein biosynthesis integral membrane protein MurJ [Microbacterium capsulatum]|uniref:Murein biosynthesis integral membrane protein MurJ n=1 Tax=Microbacterium capsulatum TaxID=3041921 RepID=A0ABU0XI95_9MICO|nr:murein biosynthesis integral membrane protein MurJ [Microbacterium sp. ASV81]MDQ4214821.1 murein biosynthesis integral membrane protein MurJ [Microbacterium sp. ASV81]
MSSLGRASALLAAGTMVSRVTGLLRTIVLVSVIGANASAAADAFGLANQLPNDVFSLISVGVLTAVLVPQIVQAASHDDAGSAFISKLFTLGTVVLLAATGIAMLAAPLLILVNVSPTTSPDKIALATAFAYWCLPQILFYGLYALIGETLNARRIFGPFTWAPVANNVISIAGFLVIQALFGGPLKATGAWTPDRIALLGGTATLGIAIQAGILLLFWPRTRLALKPDFRWRGVGLGKVGKLAGWTLLMAVISVVAGFVQTRIAYQASGEYPSVAVMMNAWLVFMLPYSVIVHSIGTPYFTQLSEHAHAGRDDEVRNDISRSIRTLGFFLMGAMAAVAAAAVPASRIFTNSGPDAVAAGQVLLCYLAGLVPLAVLFIIQRTFYAYGDTRTPLLFTLFQCVLIVVSALAAGALVDARAIPLAWLAAAIALGQSISGTLQTIVATWLLHRRLGGIHTRTWLLGLLRFLVAAVPAGGAGWGAYLLLGGAKSWMTSNIYLGAVGAAIVGITTLAVYLGALFLMRTPELDAVKGLIRRFVPSR